jgi:pyruvate kinase
MVKHGVTIFRINFSWFREASEQQWESKIEDIGSIAATENLVLGVMLDTKGPEFRIQNVGPNPVALKGGREGYEYKKDTEILLTLDSSANTDEKTIAVEAPAQTKFKDLSERVVFCDGDYEAEILSLKHDGKSMMIKSARQIEVWKGAKVNFPGTVVTAKALSQEDMDIIKFFVQKAGRNLDKRVNFMFAQSFIKSVKDVDRLVHFLEDTLKIDDPIVIAKLETYESSMIEDNLKEIIESVTAVMIARGDLANETSRQRVPQLQREIVKVAKEFNKPVLLATQVYASMSDDYVMNCQRPEAEDVRSALELGIDGFVLTGETTKRHKDPETVVKALAAQIKEDEKDLIKSDHYEKLREPVRKKFYGDMRERMLDPNLPVRDQQWLGTTDFALAAVFRANTYRAIGLFPFTSVGGTVREMSRFYPETEIYPLTRSSVAAQRSLLCRCTHPVLLEIDDAELKGFYVDDFKDLIRQIVKDLKLRKKKPNAKYAIGTMAHPPLQGGGTDTLLRIRIDDLPL